MKIKSFKKSQIIAIIFAAVLILALAATGIYGIVTKESPIEVISDVFTSDEEKLVAKWQGEKAVSGYEFKEDGTYDSYISTFSYSGVYHVDGNKLTLTNPAAEGKVVYKFSIHGDTLTLSLLEENGEAPEETEENEYTKVDHFNMRSFTDILQDYADEVQEEDTTETED